MLFWITLLLMPLNTTGAWIGLPEVDYSWHVDHSSQCFLSTAVISPVSWLHWLGLLAKVTGDLVGGGLNLKRPGGTFSEGRYGYDFKGRTVMFTNSDRNTDYLTFWFLDGLQSWILRGRSSGSLTDLAPGSHLLANSWSRPSHLLACEPREREIRWLS